MLRFLHYIIMHNCTFAKGVSSARAGQRELSGGAEVVPRATAVGAVNPKAKLVSLSLSEAVG